MTDNDYRRIIVECEKACKERYPGLRAKRMDEKHAKKQTPQEMAAHVLSMARKMQEMVMLQKYDKLNRWVGFAQAFLVASGIRSLDECRHMNMPDDDQRPLSKAI